MFKKTAAAYELAQKFLQKGNVEKARMAMEIGDRFHKIAGSDWVVRGDRLHPAIVDGDDDATVRNLNLIDSYLGKVHGRISKIDPDIYSGLGHVGNRHKKALEGLKDLENLQKAVRDLMSTNKGRKSLGSNMALEHLKELVQMATADGELEPEEQKVLQNYIAYLQPKTGKKEDAEFYFKTPPGEII